MIFIDAGAFLARYMPSDQYHSAAVTQWNAMDATSERLCTTNLVVTETLTLLGRRTTYAFAATTARIIYASSALTIVRPEQADDFAAIVYFEKYADQKVSFTDCVSFAVMKRLKVDTAFTFDRHFQQAGFTIVPQ